MSSKSGRVLLAAAILCVAGYVFVYATGRANPPVRSDGFSYYVYLPSWFIYGDSTLGAVAPSKSDTPAAPAGTSPDKIRRYFCRSDISPPSSTTRYRQCFYSKARSAGSNLPDVTR